MVDSRLWLVQKLSLASAVLVSLIIASGAAVRLTGSGLGCSDWPACGEHQLTPAFEFHPMVEFSNRMVTILLVVVVGATLVAALRLRPRRADLAWLAGGLVIGVVGQAVLGGIVVYTKLNPYLVMAHLWWSLLIVADAVVLWQRARYDLATASTPATGSGPRRATWAVAFALVPVTLLGTATTGTGPHAGGFGGQQVARRIPVELQSMATYHAIAGVLLFGLVIGLVLTVGNGDGSPRFVQVARRLLVVLVVQVGIGWLQYLTHLPTLLVELHIIGAVMATIGTTRLVLATSSRPELSAARA